jgi:hypothetical protein
MKECAIAPSVPERAQLVYVESEPELAQWRLHALCAFYSVGGGGPGGGRLTAEGVGTPEVFDANYSLLYLSWAQPESGKPLDVE